MRLILAAAFFLAAAPAFAEPTRDEVMRGAQRCEAIADNRAWLDCFYGSAQPMRGLLGLPPAPASQTKLVPLPSQAPPPRPAAIARVAPPAPPPDPGMFGDLFGAGIVLVKAMRMQAYSFTKDGSFLVTLEDGQVWKQNSPPEPRVSWGQPAESMVVRITQGLLGSDNLYVAGTKKSYKVHRLR